MIIGVINHKNYVNNFKLIIPIKIISRKINKKIMIK